MTLLDECGPDRCDLLKLDIETSESEVLTDIGRWSERVRAIVCEFHDGLDFRQFAAWVTPAGFMAFGRGGLFRCHASAVRHDAAATSGRFIHAPVFPSLLRSVDVVATVVPTMDEECEDDK